MSVIRLGSSPPSLDIAERVEAIEMNDEVGDRPLTGDGASLRNSGSLNAVEPSSYEEARLRYR